MIEIRFKKNYSKLHNQNYAFFMECYVLKGWELSDKFKKYDSDDEYEFKQDEKYMLLVFMGDEFIPFTTVRKYNAENILKYCSPEETMKTFKIVIEGANDDSKG